LKIGIMMGKEGVLVARVFHPQAKVLWDCVPVSAVYLGSVGIVEEANPTPTCSHKALNLSSLEVVRLLIG